jgi:hypothetical protein
VSSAQYTAVRLLQPLWNILRNDQSPTAMLKVRLCGCVCLPRSLA